MTEIRLTEPVRATYLKNDADIRSDEEAIAPRGSFTVDGDYFQFLCPCGCKRWKALRLADNEKDGWIFDKNYANPTLSPAVEMFEHWHGWLRNGWWEQA